jgi:membrane-associated protease RseP (regulator of RpoE activity)
MRSMLSIVAALLAGCATSGYSQFYRSMGETPAAIAQARAAPPPKVPALEHAVGPGPQIQAAYGRRGYAMIGYSSFNSGHSETDEEALDQGAKVQADLVVLIDPHYTGSLTSTLPIATPTTQTSYTNGSATAYGPGGPPVTAYGSSTTTTYGSETSYVPITVNRFDYDALYFIRRGHWVFGASCRDANDAEHSALQSNRGAYVLWVVDGTPAFKSDVLAGDMIVAIDGAPVYGYQGLTDLLQQKRGQKADVAIVRNGQPITKSVQLNN